MGTGKTSVAREISVLLSHTCLEMDEEVLEKNNCSDMGEVFAKGGELLLRETEIALAKEYRNKKDVIISTGGGIVMNKIIIDYLKEKNGVVVFLKTSFEEITARIESDNTPRPLFQNSQQAKDLYTFRLPLYTAYADYTISTENKTPREIAEETIKIIQSQQHKSI